VLSFFFSFLFILSQLNLDLARFTNQSLNPMSDQVPIDLKLWIASRDQVLSSIPQQTIGIFPTRENDEYFRNQIAAAITALQTMDTLLCKHMDLNQRRTENQTKQQHKQQK
jgi:hypothetical protein